MCDTLVEAADELEAVAAVTDGCTGVILNSAREPHFVFEQVGQQRTILNQAVYDHLVSEAQQ